MFRTISLTAVCLILASATSVVAQQPVAKKPFKNKTARTAKASYEAAIAEAKALVAKANKEYAAKLDMAIKEVGAAGDLEEANQLAAEKKRIETGGDSFAALRRRLIGTKWHYFPKYPTQWFRFERNNNGTNQLGVPFRWYVTAKDTVASQGSTCILVWNFDANLTDATVYRFEQTKKRLVPRIR